MGIVKRMMLVVLILSLVLGGLDVAASSQNEVAIRLTDGTTITFVGDVVLFNEHGSVVRSDVYSMRSFLSAGYKIAGNLTKIKIYNLNGSQQVIAMNDTDEYCESGEWYTYPAKRLYAEDGRTIIVKVEEVESYKTVGWHENIEEIKTTLYAPDGRKIKVLNTEIESYCAAGWYTYPVCYMYDLSGNSYIVAKSEIPAYRAKGLYEDILDVKTTLYAPDGRSITVFKSEVDSYVAVGWSKTMTKAYIEEMERQRVINDFLLDQMSKSIERNRKTLENGGLGGLFFP